jgi:hypothetical protein
VAPLSVAAKPSVSALSSANKAVASAATPAVAIVALAAAASPAPALPAVAAAAASAFVPPIAPGGSAALAAVDAYAVATPSAVTLRVDTLAAHLARAPGAASSQLLAARAIFRWIAENIAYDTDGFFSGAAVRGDGSADAVLRRRNGVCSGYAVLFSALARAVGLVPVCEVAGYCKGFGYELGQPFRPGKTSHAWNCVTIDGRQYLLDSTWAAGHLKGKDFVKRFEDHYFCTDPAIFAFDHLPEQPQWQLLPQPLSLDEFGALAHTHGSFWRAGLSLRSHRSARIESADGCITLTFGGAKSAQILASHHALDAGRGSGGGASPLQQQQQQQAEHPTDLIQIEGDALVLRARYPRAGLYRLEVNAKRRDEPGSFWSGVDYLISVAAPCAESFPKSFGGRRPDDALLAPLNGRLRAGEQLAFEFHSADAVEVAVIVNRDQCTSGCSDAHCD